MLRAELKSNTDVEGFVVVGFPRNINQVRIFYKCCALYPMHSILLFCDADSPQVQCFQSRVRLNSSPTALLLDCSEMELARNLGGRRGGRLDDNKVVSCIGIL